MNWEHSAPLLSVKVSYLEYLPGVSKWDVPCNEGTLHAPHFHYVTVPPTMETPFGLLALHCLGQGDLTDGSA